MASAYGTPSASTCRDDGARQDRTSSPLRVTAARCRAPSAASTSCFDERLAAPLTKSCARDHDERTRLVWGWTAPPPNPDETAGTATPTGAGATNEQEEKMFDDWGRPGAGQARRKNETAQPPSRRREIERRTGATNKNPEQNRRDLALPGDGNDDGDATARLHDEPRAAELPVHARQRDVRVARAR